MNEDTKQSSTTVEGKKDWKRTLVIVSLVIVALAALGYGAKYLMGMFAMGALNAQLAEEGIKVSGNPLAGGSYTITDSDGKKVNIDASGEGYTMTDTEGNTFTAGANAKLPSGFPSSVPVYSGATVTSSAESLENGKKTYMVTLSSSDTFSAIDNFYKEAFGKNGWTTLQSLNLSAGYTMYTAQNSGLEAMAVIQGEASGETTVMLTVRNAE